MEIFKKNRWLIIAGLIVIINLIWFGFNISISHDAMMLRAYANAKLNGANLNHPYPLFLSIPMGLTLVSNSIDWGMKLTSIALAIAYVAGMIWLCKRLNFNKSQIIIVSILASIPFIPPFSFSLNTSMVAMLLPIFLAIYLTALEKKNINSLVCLGLATISLPFLHAQFVQAVFIILMISILLYRKDIEAIVVISTPAILLLSLSFMWFDSNGWINLPKLFVLGNIEAIKGGGIETLIAKMETVFSTGQISNMTMVEYIRQHLLLFASGLVMVPTTASFIIKNHKIKELKVIAYSMIIFAFLFFLYQLRLSNLGVWVLMRMYSFIFPLAIIVFTKEITEFIARYKGKAIES